MKKILLFGSATADITLNIDHLPSLEEDLNPSHQTITLGGCACNAAMMLKLSEVPFTLAVPVGTGLFGDFVRTQLLKKEYSDLEGKRRRKRKLHVSCYTGWKQNIPCGTWR